MLLTENLSEVQVSEMEMQKLLLTDFEDPCASDKHDVANNTSMFKDTSSGVTTKEASCTFGSYDASTAPPESDNCLPAIPKREEPEFNSNVCDKVDADINLPHSEKSTHSVGNTRRKKTVHPEHLIDQQSPVIVNQVCHIV